MTDRTAAEEVVDALREVVGRHGPNIGDDGVRLRELLTTALTGRSATASGAEAEIDALLAAGELGIPRALARGMSATTAATGMQGSGISAGLAIWVATAWETAVKAGGEPALDAASTPAPSPAPAPTPAPPAPAPPAPTPTTPPAATPPAATPLSAEARLRALAPPPASTTSTSSPTLARPGTRLVPPSRPVPDPVEEPQHQSEPDPAPAAATASVLRPAQSETTRPDAPGTPRRRRATGRCIRRGIDDGTRSPHDGRPGGPARPPGSA